MDYSTSNSFEYQKYLGELDSFLKTRRTYLEKKKGDYIYNIDKEGFTKKNKKTGEVILKITPPKYFDYEQNMQELKNKKKKCILKVKKIRDKIINGHSEPEDIGLFEQGKQEYLGIKGEIDKFQVLGENIYHISENKENINKLKAELEMLESKQREEFNKLKDINYKSSTWNNSAKQYCIFMKQNEEKKLIIQTEINLLTIDRQIENKDQQNILHFIKKKKKQLYSGNPIIDKEEIFLKKKKKTLKRKKEEPENIIFFNSIIKKYKFLSNFYMSDFTLPYYNDEGEKYTWKTVEHYFQSMKFSEDKGNNLKYLLKVKNCNSPAEAKKLGGKRKVKGVSIRKDWEQLSDGKIDDIDLKVKELIMLESLNAKFKQNKELSSKLIETGDLKLVELSKKDMYWGSNKNDDGKNMLGKLLMYVRKNLIVMKEKSKKSLVSEDSDISSVKNTEKTEIKEGGGYRENNMIKSILTKKKSVKNRVTWDNENIKEKQSFQLDDNITNIPLKSLDIEEINDDNNRGEEINNDYLLDSEERNILREINNNNEKKMNITESNEKEHNLPSNLDLIGNIMSNKNIKNINIKMSNRMPPNESEDINQLDLIDNLENVNNNGGYKDDNTPIKNNKEGINFINILDTENINNSI